jgi:hypothetical protein
MPEHGLAGEHGVLLGLLLRQAAAAAGGMRANSDIKVFKFKTI